MKNSSKILSTVFKFHSVCNIYFSKLNRYVKHHKIHQLDQTPNYDYLGHPVNAYHFIRHVASGWATVIDEVMNNDTLSLIQDLGKY